ncbi:IGS10 protein, partial [Polypterus senegalus]
MTLTLPCRIVPTVQKATFTWLLAQKSTPTASSVTIAEVGKIKCDDPQRAKRLEVLQNSTLKIQNAQPEDVGLYTCQIYENNKGQPINTTSISLVLLRNVNDQEQTFESNQQERPDVSSKQYYTPGMTLTLPCRIVPTVQNPTFTWILAQRSTASSVTIVDGGKIRQDEPERAKRLELLQNSTLKIQNAQPEDVGLYTCLMFENDQGQPIKTTSISLILLRRNALLILPQGFSSLLEVMASQPHQTNATQLWLDRLGLSFGPQR